MDILILILMAVYAVYEKWPKNNHKHVKGGKR